VIPWQNPENRLDVSGDGVVSPRDVLIIFNYLNTNGAEPLPLPTDEFGPPPFFDVSGDNRIAPNDAIPVINFLNGQSSGEGESGVVALDQGEGESRRQVAPWDIGTTLDAGLFSRVRTNGDLENDLLSSESATRVQWDVSDALRSEQQAQARRHRETLQSAWLAEDEGTSLWDEALDDIVEDIAARNVSEDDALFGELL
jgi:hypothetical protein